MQRRQCAVRNSLEEREMNQVDMKMENIELVSPSPYFVQHGEMRGDVRFKRGGVEPDRPLPHGDEPPRGSGLAAGEKRDVVAKLHKRVRQVGNDPFGPTVEGGWHGFGQRRNLGDLQGCPEQAISTPDIKRANEMMPTICRVRRIREYRRQLHLISP